MKARLLLRMESELKESLKRIAQSEKRSLSSLIVKILSDFSDSYNKGANQDGI
jgi:predicted transcriptional regulator